MTRYPSVAAWLCCALFISTLSAFCVSSGLATSYSPRADPNAVVTCGRARFTVLTPCLIRMELSSVRLDRAVSSGDVCSSYLGKRMYVYQFNDNSTLTVVNRLLDVPPFTHSINANGVLSITTECVSLQFLAKSQAFSDLTLSIKSTSAVAWEWYPGANNAGNLLGTVRSLDMIRGALPLNCTVLGNMTVHGESMHCRWGLISRDGWSLVDDTDTPLMDDAFPLFWPTNSSTPDTFDWYMFAHGHAYRQALQDFSLISGPSPMVPRYMLGIMWTRWFAFDAQQIEKVVYDYVSRALPLDVVILDMDWHVHFDERFPKDNYWTGYTWDRYLFPYANETMAFFANRQLRTAANLHDAAGVQPHETRYVDMAEYMGIDPSTNQTVPMNITQKKYAYALEDKILEPLGFDFWWIDWQQGGHIGVHTHNMNPTIWLNYLRSTDAVRRGHTNVRGHVLARYGGYGNHRYQIGFSGDVDHCWESLAFQPYFSSTATNVVFGLWSHDIIGHSDDFELSSRWVQWGAYSAIFRTHDAGASSGRCADAGTCSPVEMWNMPKRYFEVSRRAVRERSALLPYHYTLLRIMHDTAVGPLRAMYIDWPEESQSYDSDVLHTQYMLGDDMLVAPISAPASNDTGMTASSIWLPPVMQGSKNTGWYSLRRGNVFLQTTTVSSSWDLSEIPIFVKLGAVIPRIPIGYGEDVLATADRQYTNLTFTVYSPFDGMESTGRVYEDDGSSQNYESPSGYAWTACTVRRASGITSFTVATSAGFAQLPAMRGYELRVEGAMPPSSVIVNGKDVPYSRFASSSSSSSSSASSSASSSWHYDGYSLAIVVRVVSFPTVDELTVKIRHDALPSAGIGLKGKIALAQLAKDNLDIVRVNRAQRRALTLLAALGDSLSVDPSNAAQLVGQADQLFSDAVSQVQNLQGVQKQRLAYSLALLTSGSSSMPTIVTVQ